MHNSGGEGGRSRVKGRRLPVSPVSMTVRETKQELGLELETAVNNTHTHTHASLPEVEC